MPKLRLTPEEMKGLRTEARFLKLARSLQRELPWIRGVRKSGPTDDKNGVDFIVYATPTEPGKIIKIPVQVKSTYGGVVHFYEMHPTTALTIPVLALEEYLSDMTALLLIRKELTEHRDRSSDFLHLLKKQKPRPKPRDRQATKGREAVQKRISLRLYHEREIKAEIRAILR